MEKTEFFLQHTVFYLIIPVLLLGLLLTALFLVGLPLWLKVLLLPAMIFYMRMIFRDFYEIPVCIVKKADQWCLVWLDGLVTGSLCGHSTVTAWMIIVRLAVSGNKKSSCVLLRGCMSGEAWRRLRVALYLT